MIPKAMAKSQYKNLRYDCVTVYVLPKWDTEKMEFVPDTWITDPDKGPDDLEKRYALSFTMCNEKSVRSHNNEKAKHGRSGAKEDELQITFYEVHGNKFYPDSDEKLKAQHCFLSEYDDLDQSKELLGTGIPELDNKIRIVFKLFLEKNGISCFTDPKDFDKGINQFKQQFEFCRGVAPTAETTSLTTPYLQLDCVGSFACDGFHFVFWFILLRELKLVEVIQL